jgi:hypothetical protein
LKKGQRVFRIGVWHHALAHAKAMGHTESIEHLRNAGVRVCLHGDVHEMNRELFQYWRPKQMHIVGAGSFGSPAEGRSESMPRLYNLLEVWRDFSKVRVHTRRQVKPDGPWSGWNEWPPGDGGTGGWPFYEIDVGVSGR